MRTTDVREQEQRVIITGVDSLEITAAGKLFFDD